MYVAPGKWLFLCLWGMGLAAAALGAEPTLSLDRGPWRVVLDRGVITQLTHRPTKQTWSAKSGPRRLAGLRAWSGESLDPGTAAKVEVGDGEVRVRGGGAELVTSVRAEGDDLLVTQSGHREQRGVVSVCWGLAGGPTDGVDIILPHLGGKRIPASELYSAVSAGYPMTWEAPLVIVQRAGRGIAVWAEDPALRFKTVTMAPREGQLDLSFETQNWAPFEERAELAPVTWRLTAYQGDWRTPAGRYRAFMQRILQPPKPGDFARWAPGVNFVLWIYPADFARYLDVLRELAKQVDPGKTLLIGVCARQAGYDSNYPDYTPSPGFPEFTRAAQARGYHVAAWASFPGVSPHQPLYPTVEAYQYRDPFTKERLGWHWVEQDAVCHAFIDPASSVFRHALTDALAKYRQAVGMDAIHLDVSAPIWNDANGPIEGHTVVEGHRLEHEDIARALPGCVFSGESLHEITLGHDSFAQRWPSDLPGSHPHAISAFLFHEFTRSYGYCLPKPGDTFETVNRLYEGWGVLPTLRVDTVEELKQPAAQRIVRLARAFQQHNLQPDFASPWEPGTKFRWRGRDGVTAVCRELPSGVEFVCGDERIYRRIEGVNRVAVAGTVPGWLAYDERELIGLDPAGWHYVEASPRDLRAAHVSALPEGVVASAFETGAHALSFVLRSAPPKPLYSFREHLTEARTAVVREGRESALDEASGGSFMPHRISVGGTARDVIYAHPPWKQGPGETFGEFRVTVPDRADIGLDFACGIMDGAKGSDGVTFALSLNGTEAFREHILPGAWQDRRVPLEAWRGRAVTIRFTTNPGPKANTTDDWAGWADPCLTVRPAAARIPVEVSLPGRLNALTIGEKPEAVPGPLREAPVRAYRFEVTLPTNAKVEWASGQ